MRQSGLKITLSFSAMIGIVLNIPSPAGLFEVALVSLRMNFGKVQMPSKHKMRKTP
jgi:hypothetical protein